MQTKEKEAFEKIEQHIPDVELRFVKTMQIGQVAQQGDVYLHCVKERHKRGKELDVPPGGFQLAVGTATGARHMAVGNIKCYEGTTFPPCMHKAPETLLGPMIKAPERFTVEHPEHPHHSLPCGVYQVTYQMNRDKQRVQD